MLNGAVGVVVLIAAWSVALAGAPFTLVWIDAPAWLISTTYVAITWIAIIAIPELMDRLGIGAVLALALGGILYQRRRSHLRASERTRCQPCSATTSCSI